jgi:hypothetical protein
MKPRRSLRDKRSRPLIPNVETITAIEAARSGELITVGSPDALLDALAAD